MRATLLFPGDYFSLNNPNDNFTAELDAVVACDNLDPLLFNYDEYIDGSPLRLSKPASECAELLIYRGWMMKPEQYERFYDDLVNLGFDPLTEPSSYERMHCFPNAAEYYEGQTPAYKVYPAVNGRVEIDVGEMNAKFDRFMIKDYVKSVKGTAFPAIVKTPVTQEELDGLIGEFIKLRGELFTGGIVLIQGAIGLDYSVCYDFPVALKDYNHWRNSTCTYWLQRHLSSAVPQARCEDGNYRIVLAGFPKHSTIAIGARSMVRDLNDRAVLKKSVEHIVDFPELKDEFDDYVSWQDGMDTGAFLTYEDVFRPHIESAIGGDDASFLERAGAFIEELYLTADEYAMNVVYVGILEGLKANCNNEKVCAFLKPITQKEFEELKY